MTFSTVKSFVSFSFFWRLLEWLIKCSIILPVPIENEECKAIESFIWLRETTVKTKKRNRRESRCDLIFFLHRLIEWAW